MRKTNWVIGIVGLLAAAFALAGCADQTDMDQLNKNEFTLRGMIAADRQEIDALKAQVAQQNDQIDELKHGAAADTGSTSGMNDRVASLEAEVKALQAGLAATPGAVPPPGAPADSVGGGAPAAGGVAPAAETPAGRTCSTANSRRDSADLAGRARSGDCRRCELE